MKFNVSLASVGGLDAVGEIISVAPRRLQALQPHWSWGHDYCVTRQRKPLPLPQRGGCTGITIASGIRCLASATCKE